MNILLLLVAAVPGILSTVVSGIYAYVALKKAKEPPRDVAWETATAIIGQTDYCSNADDFAQLYLELKFLHDYPDELDGAPSIQAAIHRKRQRLGLEPPEESQSP